MITKKEYIKRLKEQEDMVSKFLVWLEKKAKRRQKENDKGKRNSAN